MDIVFRAITLFLFVWLVTRAVGRRELSTLEPFDLILLIVLGDLIQQGVTQNDFSVTGLVLAAGTIAVMTVLVSYGTFRFPFLRPVMDGEPVILVQDGTPIARNLKRQRITEGELLAQARLAGHDSLEPVRWAVLETNGQISFIPSG